MPRSALRSSGTAVARMALIVVGVFFTQPIGMLVVDVARFRDAGDPLFLLILLGGIASFSTGTILSHRADAARMGNGDATRRRPDAVWVVSVVVLVQFVCLGALAVARLSYARTQGALSEALVPQGLSLLVSAAFVVAAIEFFRRRGWAYWVILVGVGMMTFASLIELATLHREVTTAIAENAGRVAVILYLLLVYYLTKPSVRRWVFGLEHARSH